jgi:alpha-tubulin suppressor-like RCC1 family protein
VVANQSGLSLADSQTAGSFTASFTSPAALSSDVYKITVESSGNGSSSVSSVTVSAFTFTDIQTGYRETCGLTSSGTVWCWGQGANGSLGNGDNQNSIYPVQVIGLTGISMISFTGSTGCALTSGGQVKCWGDGGNGTLGNGQNNITSSTPVTVQNISNAISVGITGSTACAVISGGTIKCWGYNYWGDAGNGTDGGNGANPTIPYSHIVDPTLVSGISNATYAMGGGCALLSTGAIKCWGYGANGQLGDGNNSINSGSKSNTPVSVTGISNATQISGSSTRCAVLDDNSVKCWGSNAYSALGNGATSSATPSPTPVFVSGISNATQISVYGMNNACAVLSTGTIKCWGAYQGGMLGSNTNSDSSSPVVIAGISNATKVSVGDSHVCAILTGGQVKCWGDNSYGQFGNGTTTSSATPS